MSWKTSVFGLMAAIGAAIVGAMQIGAIDAATLPAWVKGVATLMSVIGTAAIGFFARDNDKTSEDVGADQKSSDDGSLSHLLVCIGGIIVILGAGALLMGCQATPARMAYNTVAAPATTVDVAMTAWGDYVGHYHPPAATEAKVRDAFQKYQAAELLAIDAAQIYADQAGSTNSFSAQVQAALAGQGAQRALADLVNLLQSLGVKM
jgi:hypothetical protein